MALLAALPGPGRAQDKPPPPFVGGVETVHSTGIREIETVISRAGWHLMGRTPEGYRIGTGRTEGTSGATAAALQACGPTALQGHGAFERTIPAGEYAGKRVRVTGRVKLSGEGLSTFYINVIGPGGGTLHHVDLQNEGSQDWEVPALVADVSGAAAAMDIGVTLWGGTTGTVWLDRVTIETVDESVPLTGRIVVNGFERPFDARVVSCNGLEDGVRN